MRFMRIEYKIKSPLFQSSSTSTVHCHASKTFRNLQQGCGVGVGVARSRGKNAGCIMGVEVGAGGDRIRDNDKE